MFDLMKWIPKIMPLLSSKSKGIEKFKPLLRDEILPYLKEEGLIKKAKTAITELLFDLLKETETTEEVVVIKRFKGKIIALRLDLNKETNQLGELPISINVVGTDFQYVTLDSLMGILETALKTENHD